MTDRGLPPDLQALVDTARTATLATIRPDGRPRLVPVCYAVGPASGRPGRRLVLYSPLDEKPKRSADPHALARVADILAHPEVELLVERWDEDWARLAWVRLEGTASILEPDGWPEERTVAIAALRAKYPQYLAQRLEDRPLLRVLTVRRRAWRATEPG